MLALLFAATCYGFHVENVIILAEPEADSRVCIYRNDPGGNDWIWYMAVPAGASPGPFCTTVYPGWSYGRVDVPRGRICPQNPEHPTPLQILSSED